MTLTLLLFVAFPALGENPWTALSQSRSILKSELPPCTADAAAQNRQFLVRDCVTKVSCATTGSEAVLLVCDGTSYRAVNATPDFVEYKVANVTVADDAAGTKPTGAIPVTSDFVTCTCNDATGCTMSIAEPAPTSGFGRSLRIVSIGTGNCEFADSAGVTEIGSAVVLEPTSQLLLTYLNASWYRATTADNVP